MAKTKKIKSKANAVWDLAKETISPTDHLLECLVLITKLLGRPAGKDSLSAGMPLKNNRFSPEIFLRSAERAGFSARIAKQSLEEMNSLALPAVILLADGTSCVLLEILKNDKAVLLQPEAGCGEKQISLKELNKLYSGYVIFVRQNHRFEDRIDETSSQKPKHWFWSVIAQSWPVYSEVLVASFLINLFVLAQSLFIMNVYDRVVPNYAFETLWVLTIGVVIVFAFEFLLRALRGYFLDLSGKNIDISLSSKTFEQILGMELGSRPQSLGALANTVHSFEAFREFLTSASMSLLIDIPFILIFVAVITYIGGSMGLVPLLGIPLVLGVGFLIQVPLNNLINEGHRFSAQKNAVLLESIQGMENIKCSGAEGHVQSKWESLVCAGAKLSRKVRFLSNLGVQFSTFIQHLATITVVIIGVYKISEGELSLGGLIACTILTSRALAPISQLATLLIRYYQSRSALESANELMKLPRERPFGKVFLHRPKLKGDIDFKSVSFNYPTQPVKALHDLSFSIRSGEKVGVIGRIGSGKTTLGKLVMGLYSPKEGQILIDGAELHQLDPAELRRNIGYVSQESKLFYGSVKDNIVFGAPYIDDEAIIRAADISGVNQIINRHPDGFDMQVGEQGAYLSSGQRQSITIARSLLLDPPVLIFDDPTNDMDDRTEAQFKEKMSHFLNGKTLLLTTHRGSMLSLVDRLIVVDGGKIVADGPTEKVLEAIAKKRVRARA